MFASRPKKASADLLAAPARRRVANPRQGDFAKPDREMAGERPAIRPHNNGNTTTKVPNKLLPPAGDC
jgi:hypothetical protein